MKRKDALLVGCATLGCALYPSAGVSAQPVSVENGIPVAFVVGPMCNLIDLAGPWEAFSAVWQTKGTHQPPPTG
ncbi:MAG: hypothetical protein JO277_06560, partial [Candidatus Eremiobacteraeota bacterium]|nr:hypothetical protein [Candidatus Eremiobacteraeota bacterium]